MVIQVLSTQFVKYSDPLFLFFSLIDHILIMWLFHYLVKQRTFKKLKLNPLILPTSSSRKFDRKGCLLKAGFTSKITNAPILLILN